MNRFTADLLLLLTAAIWGLAFVFQKTAMDAIGPYTFIAARTAVAALVLLPLAYMEANRAGGAPLIPRRMFPVVAIGGVFFFVAGALQQIGLKTATVTNAGFLTALYVIFTPFAAWAWRRVAPAAVVWPAAILSIVGTWLLGGGSIEAFNGGDVLITLSAVFWAIHVLVTSESNVFNRPLVFTCGQFAVVCLLATIMAATTESPTLAGLIAAAPEIAYVGVLSSALTFTLLAVAMKHTPPSEAAVLVSTESLFAALAGAILIGERIGFIAGIGAGLIIVATLLVQASPWLKDRRKVAHANS